MDNVNLSPLDHLRRLFGQPTLLEQMRNAKTPPPLPAQGLLTPVAPVAQPTGFGAIAGGLQAPSPTESRFNPGVGLRERQNTLDAAIQELNRQNGVR